MEKLLHKNLVSLINMRNLKYLALVVVAFCVATTISFAQTYTIYPQKISTSNALLEDLQTLIIRQVNITNDTLQLHWKKVSASVPDSWEASICDNQLCNTTLPDSGSMGLVMPNDYGFLLIHCTPHVSLGSAIIRYSVFGMPNFLL